MKRCQYAILRMLTVFAAGGLLTALAVSCDPVTGSVFVDRYDEDAYGGYFDFGFTVDDVFYDDRPLYNDVFVFGGY